MTSRQPTLISLSCDCSGLCREQILERKRREYRDMVPNYYDIQAAERSAEDDTALRQVRDPRHTLSLCDIRCSNFSASGRHWMQ